MTLAEKIAALRGERKLSQGDLAEKLDVSRQSVSKWETGQAVPELDKIIKLADLFGVSVDELVREEEELPTEEPPADSPPGGDAETPSDTEPHVKVVYVDRKSFSPIQRFGIAILVLGLLAVILGVAMNGTYMALVGAGMVILGLPFTLARKHPFLVAGWVVLAVSCLILNPRTSVSPWGLGGGLHYLHIYLTKPELHYSTYLFAAIVGITRGFLFLALVFFTARLFFRARAARKQDASEETA